MLYPVEYYADSVRLTGNLIVHVPWPSNMTQVEMGIVFDQMDELWRNNFNDSIHGPRDHVLKKITQKSA